MHANTVAVYLAKSVFQAAVTDGQWRVNATCALANKLARICYARLRDHEPYGAGHLHHKLNRVAFEMFT